MGRTNPTFRDTLRAVEERWQPYRRALRYEDQQRFDRLLADVESFADAAGNLNHEAPVVPILLSVALAQRRRIDELETAMADDHGADSGERSTTSDGRDLGADDCGR